MVYFKYENKHRPRENREGFKSRRGGRLCQRKFEEKTAFRQTASGKNRH